MHGAWGIERKAGGRGLNRRHTWTHADEDTWTRWLAALPRLTCLLLRYVCSRPPGTMLPFKRREGRFHGLLKGTPSSRFRRRERDLFVVSRSESKILACVAWLWLFRARSSPAIAQARPATGPLRVLSANPRYFTDGSGRAIYLAGSHNWQNFQDNGHRLAGGQDPPTCFDYDAYLDFLQAHGHNFFRLWRWETPKWTDVQPEGVIKYCRPHPWVRSGPGMASDGKSKFDLSRFDPSYFDRMRTRLIAARDRGIYVSIMLFEGWELQCTDAWTYHPFNLNNNVNGIDADANGDGRGLEFNTLQHSEMGKRVLALQEAYVRKIIDAVNDLDNVLYEVCNEAGRDSTDWQYYIINFIRTYEFGKPKQHPVGMTFQGKGGTNELLYKSPADWISPNPGGAEESYRDDPLPAPGTRRRDRWLSKIRTLPLLSSIWPTMGSLSPGKVIVNDTDHLWGHTGGDSVWVWKSFCRGLNVLFMEELPSSPTWQDSARAAMGQTRRYSEKMNLAAMVPSNDLAETKYCLADAGKEFLVFQPGNKGGSSPLSVDDRFNLSRPEQTTPPE